jgi:uncharacterized membrane protein
MDYTVVKWVHILSSTMLFGTGIGSAFYMLMTCLSRDAHSIRKVSGLVVMADWLFTTPTIIIQPLSGFYLAYLAGYPLDSLWLLLTYGLYILAGACWLPVVWIQIQMHHMAQEADTSLAPLPARFWSYLRYWIVLGIPAFFALVVVFYLMVAKPT